MIATKEIHIILQAARERIWRGMQQLEQELAVHLSFVRGDESAFRNCYYCPAPGSKWKKRDERAGELREQIDSHATMLQFLDDIIEHRGDTKERAKLFAQYLSGDRSFLQPRK